MMMSGRVHLSGRRFRRLAAVVLGAGSVLTVLLGGCNRSVESFAVQSKNPETIALREQPGVAPEHEGRLRSSAAPPATPLYHLQQPLGQAADGHDFVLEYSSTVFATLVLRFGENTEHRYPLPASGGRPVRMHARLPETGLTAFQVRAENPLPEEKSSPSLQIRKVEIAPRLTGYRRTGTGDEGPEVHAFSAGVEGSFLPSRKGDAEENLPGHFRIRFPEKLGETSEGRQSALQLNYRSTTAETKRLRIILEGSRGETAKYDLFAKQGRYRVVFYQRALGFVPRGLRIEEVPPTFTPLDITFDSYSTQTEEIPEPLPADMGTILRYPEKEWRQSEWEIFSWNLFPSILVFDFRDYRLQSAFLKRLAFFVEKKGTAGTLLTDEELKGRHGWNAHDYRAEDLARFFTLARQQQFSLNEQEKTLRRMLLEYGIIEASGEEFRGGEGGFLSFAQESTQRLRYLFASHEGYHGFFFAAPEFRREVRSIWESLSPEEQQFWHRFLRWKTYNTEDTYLVVNEFQAYLMQQRLSMVARYFRAHAVPQFLRAHPEYREEVEAFLRSYPEHFEQAARRVEQAAQRVAGLRAGDLLCLRPVE